MGKKVLSILVTTVLTMSMLAGCGSTHETELTPTDATPTKATEAEGATADKVEETVETLAEGGEYADVKVACLVKTESNVYWSDMGAAILSWADENGAAVDMYYAESEENIAGQLEQMENLITKGYDAICFAPLTSVNLVEGVAKATEAGIICVNIDESMDFTACREADGVVYSNFVTDNYIVGQKAAKYIAEKLGGEGKVAIVEGAAGNTTSQQRTGGATDTWAEMDGIELVASQPGDWDRMTSMDVASAMITANPDLKAIYCCNDVEALGVTEAVINANKLGEILVVGTDATADGKNSIAKGEETASVGQDNTGIGIESVKSAIEAVKAGFVPTDHIGDESYPAITYVDSFLVDSDNVADYK